MGVGTYLKNDQTSLFQYYYRVIRIRIYHHQKKKHSEIIQKTESQIVLYTFSSSSKTETLWCHQIITTQRTGISLNEIEKPKFNVMAQNYKALSNR